MSRCRGRQLFIVSLLRDLSRSGGCGRRWGAICCVFLRD
ncbi:hypothetical protein ASZ90_010046 [hydrocarbon metagenome]|uniref:Uncharacterized protein n=1 Tax=hydrocarbon metagenome TaxID=938273 RepID=A0A0W8FH71_9ZZZZ